MTFIQFSLAILAAAFRENNPTSEKTTLVRRIPTGLLRSVVADRRFWTFRDRRRTLMR